LARVLTKTTILFKAPVDSKKVIWNIEVATIKETGKEAIIPARLAVNPTRREVLKKRQLIAITRIHPANPLESADHFARVSKASTAIIGIKVSTTSIKYIILLSYYPTMTKCSKRRLSRQALFNFPELRHGLGNEKIGVPQWSLTNVRHKSCQKFFI
jgi:hypothetical protein